MNARTVDYKQAFKSIQKFRSTKLDVSNIDHMIALLYIFLRRMGGTLVVSIDDRANMREQYWPDFHVIVCPRA